MRKEGNIIIWDVARREGDCLVVGEDLQEHLRNLFGIGKEERGRFARKESERTGEYNLWYEQLCLLDKFAFTLLVHANEIRVALDGEGWNELVKVVSALERLNRKMNK